ncbi:galectin-3 isoform X3 [Perca fluviatilis]|uniref:galectin-3 isoform X3 n=1 Tax=Perca fluviatilis TaxID=8168 RepID=UPI00196661E3|nr:galectin-3 isoform X3 [Perca fluviatilis]
MLEFLLLSNGHVCNCKLVSSILSTLSLPHISALAPDPDPDPSISPSSPSPPHSQHSEALCGSCPSSGSAPQANSIWPSLPQPGAGFPAWPGQPGQSTQPAPCWTGQPNTPCWPGTTPAPVSVPQAMTPAPAPSTNVVQAPAQVPAPAAGQPCQPCWPGTQYQPSQYQPPQYQPSQYQPPQYQPPQYQPPQYQPPQQPAPVQAQVPTQIPAPTPVSVPVPAPAPATSIRPNVPGWPAHPGWPYNPGQSGWPGQSPSAMPPHWLPPTSGPLSVPYNLNLARGIYDKMMMTILGHVKPNAKMFTVNFLRGNDIAFHINPRFSEGGKQALVRNHKLAERWGPEERDLNGPFPFAQGSPFEANVWKRWKGLESRLCKRVLDKGTAALQEDSWR